MIIPRWCHITVPFGFVPWQLNKSHTARAPYPTIHTIKNRNAYISVLNDVLWDMGHVHCGICENCVSISSWLAWCHHATGLYLASDGQVTNKLERNPTTLKFSSRGREEGAVRQALRQRQLSRSWPGSSQHQATKYFTWKLFQFSTDSKQILCTYWVTV